MSKIRSSAFLGHAELEKITIPDKMVEICEGAFSGCSKLKAVKIPESVLSIGQSVFEFCNSLESVVVEPGNARYDSREGCNAIIETSSNTLLIGCKNSVIPESVSSIGRGAFKGAGLTQFVIPDNVKTIDNGAFFHCTDLKQISLPNSLEYIADSVFYGCSGLKEIIIPNNVYSIGYRAFDSSGLEKVDIPNSVFAIGKYAFANCGSLKEVNLPTSILSIPEGMFNGCKSLATIALPSSITSIGMLAFGHSGLKSIKLPNSVNIIRSGAFTNCYELSEVTIPSSVSKIEMAAFRYCSYNVQGGSKIIIEGTPEIQDLAFSYYTNLTDVFCLSCVPPECESNNCFINTPTEHAVLHVPTSAIDTYRQTMPWNSFGKIVELDETGIENASVNDNTFNIGSQNGIITISGTEVGRPIVVYNMGGSLIGSVKTATDKTSIRTNIRNGQIAIIKIGDKSIKVTIK